MGGMFSAYELKALVYWYYSFVFVSVPASGNEKTSFQDCVKGARMVTQSSTTSKFSGKQLTCVAMVIMLRADVMTVTKMMVV